MPFLNADEIRSHLFPAVKGSYFLVFELKGARDILIPRFGTVNLQPGMYGYSGSALGSGGIRARVRHHLNEIQKPHWHIDWLRPELDWVGIYYQFGKSPWECTWVQHLRKESGAETPIPGFGASDCTHRCSSHLLYSPTNKALSQWIKVLNTTTKGNQEMEYNGKD